jgi:CheY-like chemotaxis protein
MKLLIAEDNEKIRGMLKDLTSIYFSEVFECDNGKTAYEIFMENKPDWILMDIEMPEMDGITATKKIRESDPDAKVIIVTGYESTALRKNAKDAGAISYILKENMSEILKILNS